MQLASQNHKKRNIVIVGVVGLLSLCVLCLIGAAVNSNVGKEQMASKSPSKLNATAVFKSALETASAQVTPHLVERNSSPVAPTVTIQPTQEIIATVPVVDLPTKTVDASILVYNVAIQDKLKNCREGLIILGNKSTEVSQNHALLFDSTWKFQMAAGLVIIKQHCTTFSEVTPVPSKLQPCHSYLVLAENQYKIVVQNMVEGIDEINADKINIANSALDQANAYILNATSAIPRE